MTRKTALVLAALSTVACSKEKTNQLTIPVAAVERQTIVVDAQATGVVEPINVIEVKAKSSGQIIAMPVETGTYVKTGDLLIQLDTRDTRNSYSQAKADLDAALIRARVSRTARDRSSQLFKERIITSAENEASEVEYANAQATVLRNRAALDLRAQALEEATVRAPVSGTVIEKPVSIGQVIASGTGTFGGGTTILKMADLTKVRVRTLVNETDIGKVRAGLPATVTVDAFPDRPFVGVVEKIEPQATIQQAVTMFPVLVSIDNMAGLLMPGMNGEVSIEVERRDNALAISNDAVRSPNEVVSVATMLGLNPDSVRAAMRGGRDGQNAGGPRGGPPAGATASPASQTGGRQGGNLPAATPEQCAQFTAALAKNPAVQKQLADLRSKMMAGEIEREAMQSESQKLYAAAGVDPAIARACLRTQRTQSGQGAQSAQSNSPQQGQQGGFGGQRGGGGRRGMVFVVNDGKYTPKMVRLGVSNYDVSEVVSGLAEGDSVAILNVAAMQARQQEELDRMRSRTGMPGMQRQQPQGQQGQQGQAQGGQRQGAGASRQ
ncbi:MAG: efflux RND transporter periplasmic adaptor subunit [Gemmatimonadota bacterium]|nr:efflux RND transporter periplasmic adaptor subunit [Gemmatimonadota bacterium]